MQHKLILITMIKGYFDDNGNETIFCISIHGPPLWSSSESAWLQIQSCRVRFPAVPESNSSGFGLDSREYGRRDLLRRPRYTLSAKVGKTLPTSGGCSVGIVCSRIIIIIIIIITIIIIRILIISLAC
jgi:hypothetical protein